MQRNEKARCLGWTGDRARTIAPRSPERSTRYGQLRDRLLLDPDWGRAIRWLAPLVITAIAALLRLINVAHPHQLAFDETYYVKDAWSLWTLGYEGTWGENANDAFVTLQQLPLSEQGAFIVHPRSASGSSRSAWRSADPTTARDGASPPRYSAPHRCCWST